MTGSWAALIGLGAFHGINPGMGWLFAVALGLQERRRGAVLSALLPLGVGHALAVAAAAIALAVIAGAVIPLQWVRWFVAAILVVFGVSRLFRHRHPSWASMRVSKGGLTLWSFLMASAHGAGLMVVPLFLAMTVPVTHHGMAMHASTPETALRGHFASCFRLSGDHGRGCAAGVRKVRRCDFAEGLDQSGFDLGNCVDRDRNRQRLYLRSECSAAVSAAVRRASRPPRRGQDALHCRQDAGATKPVPFCSSGCVCALPRVLHGLRELLRGQRIQDILFCEPARRACRIP